MFMIRTVTSSVGRGKPSNEGLPKSQRHWSKGTGLWSHPFPMTKGFTFPMQDDKDHDVPPPVLSGDPERELEQKLRRNPDDDDAKVDVGSDESMDASDPPSSSQPG